MAVVSPFTNYQVKTGLEFLFMATRLSIHILYSRKRGLFYVGKTWNLDKRLDQHNNGESGFTRSGIPWSLIWYRTFININEGESLERKLKNLPRIRKIKFIKKY